VALGNAGRQALDPSTRGAITRALEAALPLADSLVAEHIGWALAQAAPA